MPPNLEAERIAALLEVVTAALLLPDLVVEEEGPRTETETLAEEPVESLRLVTLVVFFTDAAFFFGAFRAGSLLATGGGIGAAAIGGSGGETGSEDDSRAMMAAIGFGTENVVRFSTEQEGVTAEAATVVKRPLLRMGWMLLVWSGDTGAAM